jgi:XapX domain-containing protein
LSQSRINLPLGLSGRRDSLTNEAWKEKGEQHRESSDMSDQAISYSAVPLAFATGLAVGVVFSLVKLPSPAPPFLGLIGLVGMFAGQRIWPFLASRFFHH